MAKILSKSTIVSLGIIRPWHVTQSIDAFAGTDAYDITLSGSMTMTGDLNHAISGQISGSARVITNTVNTQNIESSTDYVTFADSIVMSGVSNNHITSSGNYSSSGDIFFNPSNVSTGTSVLTIDPTTGQVFRTGSYGGGSGGGSTSAAGNNFEIQYNSASAFQAINSFKFNYFSQSLEQGFSVIASGSYSHAEGILTKASGDYSHAEGSTTVSNGVASHAEGQETSASSTGAHSEGMFTHASGSHSHAEGVYNLASGSYSHVEGHQNTSSGFFSHAEGANNNSLGYYSHVEGRHNTSSGISSHAEGSSSLASGNASHAEGFNTKTFDAYSHAEGLYTIASGSGCHAEGFSTLASSRGSHAEGYTTSASGQYSHAAGWGTEAKGTAQSVIGIHNLPDETIASFIVGNGADANNKSNLIHASGSIVEITGSLVVTGSITGSNLVIGPNTNGHLITSQNYTGITSRFDGGAFFTIQEEISKVFGIWHEPIGAPILQIDTDPNYFLLDPTTDVELKVGIGVTTPTASLDITGDIRVSSHITASGNISSSGNLTALDLNLFGGDIDLKNAGAQSNIKFYCESANAHYTKLQAAPHSAYSGNPTVTLPAYDLDFAAPNFQANVTASTFNGDGSALTNLQRPISNSVSTHFTASNLNSGFYFRAGGNVTCSIQSSSLVSCNVGNEFEIFQTSSAGYVLFLTIFSCYS